jgi:hypothetical protein
VFSYVRLPHIRQPDNTMASTCARALSVVSPYNFQTPIDSHSNSLTPPDQGARAFSVTIGMAAHIAIDSNDWVLRVDVAGDPTNSRSDYFSVFLSSDDSRRARSDSNNSNKRLEEGDVAGVGVEGSPRSGGASL